MKDFFRKVYCIFVEFGYARAASELARNGRYKEAQNLMLRKKDCKC
jgi:hypothetical protein